MMEAAGAVDGIYMMSAIRGSPFGSSITWSWSCSSLLEGSFSVVGPVSGRAISSWELAVIAGGASGLGLLLLFLSCRCLSALVSQLLVPGAALLVLRAALNFLFSILLIALSLVLPIGFSTPLTLEGLIGQSSWEAGYGPWQLAHLGALPQMPCILGSWPASGALQCLQRDLREQWLGEWKPWQPWSWRKIWTFSSNVRAKSLLSKSLNLRVGFLNPRI
ncbi:hypothetical protein GGR56DRAFT_630922 [Xylariaceae sp. FL0804]|nr:hypothetical protein GGR56DRAFT_630922 [Xylariaceae sp. FL0804]